MRPHRRSVGGLQRRRSGGATAWYAGGGRCRSTADVASCRPLAASARRSAPPSFWKGTTHDVPTPRSRSLPGSSTSTTIPTAVCHGSSASLRRTRRSLAPAARAARCAARTALLPQLPEPDRERRPGGNWPSRIGDRLLLRPGQLRAPRLPRPAVHAGAHSLDGTDTAIYNTVFTGSQQLHQVKPGDRVKACSEKSAKADSPTSTSFPTRPTSGDDRGLPQHGLRAVAGGGSRRVAITCADESLTVGSSTARRTAWPAPTTRSVSVPTTSSRSGCRTRSASSSTGRHVEVGATPSRSAIACRIASVRRSSTSPTPCSSSAPTRRRTRPGRRCPSVAGAAGPVDQRRAAVPDATQRVEGADLGRLHRDTEADRLRRPGGEDPAVRPQ